MSDKAVTPELRKSLDAVIAGHRPGCYALQTPLKPCDCDLPHRMADLVARLLALELIARSKALDAAEHLLLMDLLRDIRDDLIRRADIEGGEQVVAIGASLWNRLVEAVGEPT